MKRPVAQLGILGSGQLGRMLWEAATQRCEISARVFGQAKDSSAARAGVEVTEGSVSDTRAILGFVESVEHVAIESEFIPAEAVRELASRPSAGKWTPPLKSLLALQTKIAQKDLLAKLRLPTARWMRFDRAPTEGELRESLSGPGAIGGKVLKASHGGYDGKGTLIVASEADVSRLGEFLKANSQGPYLLEEMIPFRAEFAMVACRDRRGRIFHYPLVESRQKSGICHQVLSLDPDRYPVESLEKQAALIAGTLLEELDWRGVMGIEFFWAGEGLLVNELAPRVHNSAHFTLEASRRSQFETQVRVAVGMDVSAEDFETKPSFAMLNLLGPAGVSRPLPPIRILSKGLPRLYDYEKNETRPGRKLGHWNWTSDSPVPRAEVEQILLEMTRDWELWLNSHLSPGGL